MNTTEKQEEAYITSLSSLEKKACEIAENHLGTSFNTQKSIGYQKWSQEQKEKEQEKTRQGA